MKTIFLSVMCVLCAATGFCQEPVEEIPPLTLTIASDKPAYAAGEHVLGEGKDIIVLDNLVYVDMYSSDYTTQHPLVCIPGGDFPTGHELIFKNAKTQESVHAVFSGITPPKDLKGKFVLYGHFQGIKNWSNYKFKKPSGSYRYFVISSWKNKSE